MTFKFALAFLLFFTSLKTVVHASECYTKFLEEISPSFDQCSLFFNGTLTVNLKDFVEKPECLNENTVIGFKLNQKLDDDWDQIQNPPPNTVLTFHLNEKLCRPANLTVGLNFWDGQTFVGKKVRSELNLTACVDKSDISDNEKSLIKTNCPNITSETTTEASASTTTKKATTGANTETTTSSLGIICALAIICAVLIALVVKRRIQQKSSLESETEEADIRTEFGKWCFETVYNGTIIYLRQVG